MIEIVANSSKIDDISNYDPRSPARIPALLLMFCVLSLSCVLVHHELGTAHIFALIP